MPGLSRSAERQNKKVSKKIIRNFKYIDIIIFTNVFAHINNLAEVLKSLKILISENTIIVIENHYLGSVLEKKQFDTFYHEHPRTYSLTSFVIIAKKINLYLENFSFPKRYGGNIRVILSNHKIIKDYKKQLEKEKIFYRN
jgi:regulator of replication initiation timing